MNPARRKDRSCKPTQKQSLPGGHEEFPFSLLLSSLHQQELVAQAAKQTNAPSRSRDLRDTHTCSVQPPKALAHHGARKEGKWTSTPKPGTFVCTPSTLLARHNHILFSRLRPHPARSDLGSPPEPPRLSGFVGTQTSLTPEGETARSPDTLRMQSCTRLGSTT